MQLDLNTPVTTPITTIIFYSIGKNGCDPDLISGLALLKYCTNGKNDCE